LRHAKSSWDNPQLDDFARPLAPRGIGAMDLVGKFMAEVGISPELVLCSPAQRTRQTLELLAPCLPEKPATKFPRKLYHASAGELLQTVRNAGDDYSHIMLIGHNEGIKHLILKLSGSSSDAQHMKAIRKKFPTAALVSLVFAAAHWRDIGPHTGKIQIYQTPKKLQEYYQ
jgi:phosphohistidine phosphatase